MHAVALQLAFVPPKGTSVVLKLAALADGEGLLWNLTGYVPAPVAVAVATGIGAPPPASPPPAEAWAPFLSASAMDPVVLAHFAGHPDV